MGGKGEKVENFMKSFSFSAIFYTFSPSTKMLLSIVVLVCASFELTHILNAACSDKINEMSLLPFIIGPHFLNRRYGHRP